MMKLKLCAVLGLLLSVLATWAHGEISITDGKVQGRIYNSSSNAGVPSLTVKLVPPYSSHLSEQVTVTGTDGRFDFQDPAKGAYLLEVYEGVQLLYRDVIDTQSDSKVTVPLQPKEP